MSKTISSRESINWVKPPNLMENGFISDPAENVPDNSLRMRSSRSPLVRE